MRHIIKSIFLKVLKEKFSQIKTLFPRIISETDLFDKTITFLLFMNKFSKNRNKSESNERLLKREPPPPEIDSNSVVLSSNASFRIASISNVPEKLPSMLISIA